MRDLFFVAGLPDQMVTAGYCMCIFASEEMEMWWTHGGMKYVWIYQSYSDIMLVLNWEHIDACILDLERKRGTRLLAVYLH